MLRLTRATRFLPRIRGVGRIVGTVQSLYLPFVDRRRLYRISNFDGDLQLDVNPAETIGAALWHIPQLYERHERQVFCASIRPGCTVLDVGANIGIYTLLAAKRGAKVFAIEFDPQNAKMLRHHISLNGFEDSVTVFDLAASDHEHRVDLRRNPRNSGGSTIVPGDSIPARTIDSLNLPLIDICKMDIEGSEVAALRGMRETIRRSRGMKLLIEYSANLRPAGKLLVLLHSQFAHIAVAGKPELREKNPPAYCNLWCWNH
jgi:FkbM family methyltransferase